MKALAGLIVPTTGRVICRARAAGRFAYLPQQAEIDRNFPVTIREFVTLGGWRSFGAFRAAPQALAERVREVVAAVGLFGEIDRQISALSVGQFQRALFGRLLLQDASVILLDEPFAAVDEATTGDLIAIMQRLHHEARTVIAALHDFEQVRTHFPQCLLLARRVIA